jgi:hypothetical protein
MFYIKSLREWVVAIRMAGVVLALIVSSRSPLSLFWLILGVCGENCVTDCDRKSECNPGFGSKWAKKTNVHSTFAVQRMATAV